MAVKKLSAPVGETKRITEGKAVKNNKADIELVQQMLIDNGASGITITGRSDAKLVKAIQAFQKSSLRYAKPDGIVDPGLATEKKLVTKYATAQKKRDSIKYAKVTIKGKEYIVTEAELKKVKSDAIKGLKPLLAVYRTQYDVCWEIYQKYETVAIFEKTYLAAVSTLLVLSYSGVSLPSGSFATKASSDLARAERALSSGDFAGFSRYLPAAEASVNKFSDEMYKFLKAFNSSASTIHTTLTLTTAVGWVVVGALAGPVLVTGAGLTAAQSVIVAGGTTAALQSVSTEVGKIAMSEKPITVGTIAKAALNIQIDALTGAVTGALGSKIKLQFIDDLAKKLSPMMVKTLSGYMSEKAVQALLKTYLANSGKALVTSAAEEAISLIGKTAKSGGKPPTQKELLDSAANILFKTLTAGLIKNLQSFNAKWSLAARDTIAKKLGESAIGKLTKDKDIGRMVQAKLVKDIGTGAIGGVAAKFGFDKAIESATGSESVDKLLTSAEKAVLIDAKIKKLVADKLQEYIMEERTQTSDSY